MTSKDSSLIGKSNKDCMIYCVEWYIKINKQYSTCANYFPYICELLTSSCLSRIHTLLPKKRVTAGKKLPTQLLPFPATVKSKEDHVLWPVECGQK